MSSKERSRRRPTHGRRPKEQPEVSDSASSISSSTSNEHQHLFVKQWLDEKLKKKSLQKF